LHRGPKGGGARAGQKGPLTVVLRPPLVPRALGFEPKKEEIKKMIADIDKDGR
jgi:hypothetical protein